MFASASMTVQLLRAPFCNSAIVSTALTPETLSESTQYALDSAAAFRPLPEVRDALTTALDTLGATPIGPDNYLHLEHLIRAMPEPACAARIQADASAWLDAQHDLSCLLNSPDCKTTEKIYAAAAINTNFLLERLETHKAVQVSSTLHISLVLSSIEMTHPCLKHHFYPLRFGQRHADGSPGKVYEVLLFDNLRRLNAAQYAALAHPTDKAADIVRFQLHRLSDIADFFHRRKEDLAIIDPTSAEKITTFESDVSVTDAMDTLLGVLDNGGLNSSGFFEVDIMWPAYRCEPHPQPSAELIDLTSPPPAHHSPV